MKPLKTTKNLLKSIVIIILILLITSVSAGEKTLVQFQPGAALNISETETAQGIISKYRVDIDAELIYQVAKFGPARSNRRQNSSEEVVFLLLPSTQEFKLNTSIKLMPDHFGQYVDGVDTFSGSVNGDETTSFILSVENNQTSGQVRLDEYLIKLQYDNILKSQVLSLVDLRLMPKDSKEPDIMKATAGDLQLSGNTQSSRSSTGQGNIRISFYYTAKVAARNNINSMVANILSELNTSVDLSRINPNVDFTLASMHQLSSNLDGVCKNQNLSSTSIRARMEFRTTPFHNIDSDLDQFNADVALAIVTTESGSQYISCEFPFNRLGGIAVRVFEAAHPIAMTTDTYALGDLTALHELGHVFGGNHEIEQAAFGIGDGTPLFSRGKVSYTDNWQTIMGGYVGCAFSATVLPSQQACTRLNRWSNPSIYYQGEATGATNVSDMESGLEVTAPIVSGWTSYPTAAPTSAPSITSDYGCSPVSWNFMSGSTHYQVFQSFTSAFYGGGNRVGVVTFPSFYFNIPFGSTQYARVRACNGNGCGPYSSIVPVSNDIICP